MLSRKYKWKRIEILKVLKVLRETTLIHTPDEYDALEAYEITRKVLSTPMDTLMLAIAKRKDLTLVTYDQELLNHDGKYCSVQDIG